MFFGGLLEVFVVRVGCLVFVGEGVSSVWGRCMVLWEVCLWKWVGFMGVWCWPGEVWVG